eukprot:Gb_04301 [translate_table: standard]
MEFMTSFGCLILSGFARFCAVILPRNVIEHLDHSIVWSSWQSETDRETVAYCAFSAEEIIRALPSSSFGSVVGNTWSAGRDAKCAVCLDDFQMRDQVRELPRCPHVFHRDCIDSWIRLLNTVCPLCRSSLVSAKLNQFST